MNATPYLHLLWKEYRAIRAFWLSLVVMVMGALWLTMALASDPTSRLNLVYSLALGAPAFFALGAAGTGFALEKEEGTFDFLRAAPVSARQVLTSKLGLTILATVAMLAVLVPIAWRITGGQLPEERTWRGMLGLWPLAAIEAVAWGAFFSLISARPLPAICMALVAVSTSEHLLAWNSLPKSTNPYQLDAYLAAAPWRATLTGMVLLADVYLGLHWLSEAEPATRASWKSWNFRRFRRRSSAVTYGQDASIVQDTVDLPNRGAMRSRLFWQHWRQSGRLMMLMGGLQIALTFLAVHGGLQDEWKYAVVATTMLAALAGGCVFLPDQERCHYRFFVEHNIPPRSVWLTRQLPWIATIAISTCASLYWSSLNLLDIIGRSILMLWSRSYYWPRLWSETGEPVPILLGIAFVAVSYAAGQWTSMFVRSGLLAGFFGLMLAGVLCCWVYLMGELNIPWSMSVLPIPIVLLAATWMRAPDWVSENMRWSARLRAAAMVLVPAAAIFTAAISNRVNQVPEVGLSFDVSKYEVEMTDASRETAAMYRRADELLVGYPEDGNDRDRRWLENNAETLSLLHEASLRASCTLDDPVKTSDDVELSHAYTLVRLILVSARELERENKLDEALDRYFEALRMIGHWRQHRASRIQNYINYGATFYIDMVLPHLVAWWSTQPGQTPERINGAIARLSALDDSMLHLDDGLKSNYLLVQRALEGDPSELAALIGKQPSLTWHLLRLRLPWERRREERLSVLSTDDALGRVESTRVTLSRGKGIFDFQPISLSRHIDSPSYWLSNNYWGIEAIVELGKFEAQKRATLLLLALEAYRLEHGKLPAKLADLVGAYLPAMPLDPYSGKDFLYFPEGVPKPVTDVESIDLAEARKIWFSMAPGTPGIWSTGPHLYAEFLPSDGLQLTVGDDVVPTPDIIYYVERDSNNRLSLYQALARGRWFAVPDARAE